MAFVSDDFRTSMVNRLYSSPHPIPMEPGERDKGRGEGELLNSCPKRYLESYGSCSNSLTTGRLLPLLHSQSALLMESKSKSESMILISGEIQFF